MSETLEQRPAILNLLKFPDGIKCCDWLELSEQEKNELWGSYLTKINQENKMSNKNHKSDPSSMSGLVNNAPTELGAAIMAAIETGTEPKIMPGAMMDAPTTPPAIAIDTEAEEARLAAQVEEEEATAREAKALLKQQAEAEAAQQVAEPIATNTGTTEPAPTFQIINSKFNDRQFGEVLKAYGVIHVDQEQRDELIRLGHPQDGFKAI